MIDMFTYYKQLMLMVSNVLTLQVLVSNRWLDWLDSSPV